MDQSVKRIVPPPSGSDSHKLLIGKYCEYETRLKGKGWPWEGLTHEQAFQKFPRYRSMVYRMNIIDDLLRETTGSRTPVNSKAMAKKLNVGETDPIFVKAWDIVADYVQTGGKNLSKTPIEVPRLQHADDAPLSQTAEADEENGPPKDENLVQKPEPHNFEEPFTLKLAPSDEEEPTNKVESA